MVSDQKIKQTVRAVLASYQAGTSPTARKHITRAWANDVIEAVMKEAMDHYQVKVVVGVTTREGHPISMQCMDDAFLISFELVLKKCYTCVALKMPTHELGKLMAQGEDLEGLDHMMNHKICGLGGGYPIYSGNELIGAVAVSGATSTIDRELAHFAQKLFERG